MSVWRVFKYRAGGEGEEVCPNESAIERFRSRIKEMNHAKSRKKRYQRGILAYVVMADGFVRWGLLKKFSTFSLLAFFLFRGMHFSCLVKLLSSWSLYLPNQFITLRIFFIHRYTQIEREPMHTIDNLFEKCSKRRV